MPSKEKNQKKRQQAIYWIERYVLSNPEISCLKLSKLLLEHNIDYNHQTIAKYRSRLEYDGKIPKYTKNKSQKNKNKNLVYNAVYFIEAVGLNLYKISYATELNDRFDQLSWGDSSQLKLIGYIKDVHPKMELDIQNRFDHSHDHGDWYHMTKELIQYIEEVSETEFVESITLRNRQLKKSRSPANARWVSQL